MATLREIVGIADHDTDFDMIEVYDATANDEPRVFFAGIAHDFDFHTEDGLDIGDEEVLSITPTVSYGPFELYISIGIGDPSER